MIGLVVFVTCGSMAIYLAGLPAAAAFGGIGVLMLIAAMVERRRWNKGHCACGHRWRMFDTDSQGGRMYKCDACKSYVDISYPFVDGLID